MVLYLQLTPFSLVLFIFFFHPILFELKHSSKTINKNDTAKKEEAIMAVPTNGLTLVSLNFKM